MLWRHKGKSGYGSKTQDEGRSGALTNNTMHKIYQQQISGNYAPAFQRVAPVNPRGIAQRKISYKVRTPAHVIHVKSINKERSIRKHDDDDRRERQRGKKRETQWLAMQYRTCECVLCEVSVVGDINAVVSGRMRIDGRIKISEPMSRKKWSRSECHESNK